MAVRKNVREMLEEQNIRATINVPPPPKKPVVDHAPRRKVIPATKEPKKPRKKPLERIEKTATAKGRQEAIKRAKEAGKSAKSKTRNPTNASSPTPQGMTLKQLADGLCNGLGYQLSEVNANLRGRRPKINQLTPKTLSQILLMVRCGVYHHHAAKAAGITPRTWRDWLDKGEDDIEGNRNSAYAQLFLLINKAEGEALVLKTIEAVNDDPKFYLTHGPGKAKQGREGFAPPSVKIEGGDDPIRHQHNHEGTIQIEGSPHLTISLQKPEGASDFAQALSNLEDLGIAIPNKLKELTKNTIDVHDVSDPKKSKQKESENVR